MNTGYFQSEIAGNKIYVKTDSVEKLRKVDAVIFDCDGVLIDVRQSYNVAISKTVALFFRELTGRPLPVNVDWKDVVYLFKKSGGYNNDWDLTYVILLCTLCKLPEEFQVVFERAMAVNWSIPDLFRRFSSVKNYVRKELTLQKLDEFLSSLVDTLKQLATISDASGITYIEKKLVKLLKNPRNFHTFFTALQHFLSYPGPAGASLLITVFEEIFCGPQLFREVYKQEPRLYNGQGLIENERVIMKPETFDHLIGLLEKTNFGIASGRQFSLAKYTLNGLLERFNSDAVVFLEDITDAEREATNKAGLTVNLKKPHPFSLFKSSGGLKPFTFAIYVGDSIEDAFVVREANQTDSRFLFVGVYDHSDCKDDILNVFLRSEVDAVIPSVNELPIILENLRGNR